MSNGLWAVQAALAVHNEFLHWSVGAYPGGVQRVEQLFHDVIGNFCRCVPSDSSVYGVEDDVLFVEHQIDLDVLVKTYRD